jgi:hypothetical protein
MLKSGEIAFDKPELGAFQMMVATADKVASSIASLTWLLLEAKEDEFVTCDRGLAMHDPTPKFPWVRPRAPQLAEGADELPPHAPVLSRPRRAPAFCRRR